MYVPYELDEEMRELEATCQSWFHKLFWGDELTKEQKTQFFYPFSNKETTEEYRCRKCGRITNRFTTFRSGPFLIKD